MLVRNAQLGSRALMQDRQTHITPSAVSDEANRRSRPDPMACFIVISAPAPLRNIPFTPHACIPLRAGKSWQAAKH